MVFNDQSGRTRGPTAPAGPVRSRGHPAFGRHPRQLRRPLHAPSIGTARALSSVSSEDQPASPYPGAASPALARMQIDRFFPGLRQLPRLGLPLQHNLSRLAGPFPRQRLGHLCRPGHRARRRHLDAFSTRPTGGTMTAYSGTWRRRSSPPAPHRSAHPHSAATASGPRLYRPRRASP